MILTCEGKRRDGLLGHYITSTYNTTTDNKGSFNFAIDANRGDIVGIWFYDTLYAGISEQYSNPIDSFLITKEKEYNVTIKTQKP